jgi:anti-sigma B factor antagonist
VADLQVNVETRSDFTLVRAAGDIDLATCPQLQDAFVAAISGGAPLVVLDAAATTFLDSSGLGVLVFANKKLRQTGGRLVVANLSTSVSRALVVTGLDAVIATHVSDEPIVPWDEPGATADSVLAGLTL